VANLRFTHWIEEDLLEALSWYDNISPSLGNRFRDEVDRTLDAIEADPERFGFANKSLNVRQVKVRGFPYIAFYQLDDATPVLYAIIHGSRDPKRWLDRIRPV
jgi:plasmid stabilization system protein ParE